jgi:signal transduction histidine kinase
VARVERIVEHLLDISRRHPRVHGATTVTALDALFDDIALLTAARARRADVRIETDGGHLSAKAPREALAQALLNLVLNAIAHSPVSGCVHVSAVQSQEGVAIAVSDEGPGIPPEERERIFEPFYSSRPDGAGLGLSVVRTLARELGWSVTVDDAQTCGAVFRLYVPGARELARTVHATPEGSS